ncbi:MbtH protein [Streptomyces sp. WMMB 714]|jgi:MbtH protein|uniref:MbtH family protein n=1 Tax=Streptomyces sp. WMMB 714 TaxID=1286822 RepID=UPI0005F7F175|nr:MbtH family NRPS accessory protein [Streptomyces sp. WMMB 714]SCK04884.1 MbtH protein [Streptomyces sp. WMMB 714]
MANPFDDPDGVYQVLVNENLQHSLWPGDISVPAGWSSVFGPDTQHACLEYVESHWTDMRPNPARAAQ